MINRREFLAMSSAAPLAYGQANKPVRIGMVGVGRRGSGLLKNLLDLTAVEIPSICDINEDNLKAGQEMVHKSRGRRPEGYSKGVEDFRRMCERDDLDAVLTATPWEWHARVALAAMNAGKYAATEVPVAITLEECWDLVNTSERTGKPCMMLENVCYYRNVLAVMNMVQQGLFGELTHAEGGYMHDVRARGKFLPDGEVRWRGMHAVRRDANLYPTHPMGPIAWWTSINRGDRFTYLTSMSSKSRGMNYFAAQTFGPGHPNAKRHYALGDVNTTMLRTENGLTITLIHDTQSPRPYDLGFKVQGTKGIYSGSPPERIYIEEPGKPHAWADAAPYYNKYDHKIWKDLGPTAKKYGHNGGDYIELHQFVKAIREKTATPIDVYDSVTWSAITPLSEKSVGSKSAPVDFPDFTRGKWKQPRTIRIEA